MPKYCSDCGKSLTQKEVEEKSRYYCSECEQIIWRNPKPVAWLLLQKDEDFLLVKRAHNPDKGAWDIPGGFLELEESFEEAAVREMKEETGVEVKASELEILDTIAFHRAKNNVVGIVFYAEVDEKPTLQAKDDAEEAKFWDVQELQDSNDEELREVCKETLLKP